MKPGYKTSEFWLNLLVFLLGAAMASGLITDAGMVAKVIGGVLALMAPLGYTAGRVGIKKVDSAGAAYASRTPLLNDTSAGVASNPTKESD